MNLNSSNNNNQLQLHKDVQSVIEMINLKLTEKKKEEIQSKINSMWVEKTIEDLIENSWKDKNTIKKQFVLKKLKEDHSYFLEVERSLHSDPEIQNELITSLIRQWVDFSSVESILSAYYWKDKKLQKKLLSLYIKILKEFETMHRDDLTKSLLDLKQKWENNLYTSLISKKIIESKWPRFILTSSFFKSLKDKLIINDSYFLLADREKDKSRYDFLLWMISLNYDTLTEDERGLLLTIIELIKIEENKYLSKKQIKEETEKDEDEYILNNESDDETWEIDPIDKIDFCLPYCSSSFSDWVYTIKTDWYMDAKLSEEELSRFTSIWLKNYIRFYHTMFDLWLWFLWTKYKSSFVTLLNNKVWFSYPDWAWVTDSRFLRVLNLLWKSMWIIWKIDDDTYIKPYDTLEWALKAFRDFKWSGKIKDRVLIDNLSDTDKMEILLKSRGYIDPKWNWLVFSEFNQL